MTQPNQNNVPPHPSKFGTFTQLFKTITNKMFGLLGYTPSTQTPNSALTRQQINQKRRQKIKQKLDLRTHKMLNQMNCIDLEKKSEPQTTPTPLIIRSTPKNRITPRRPLTKNQFEIIVEKRKQKLKDLLRRYTQIKELYSSKQIGPRKQKKIEYCEEQLKKIGGIFVRKEVNRENQAEICVALEEIEVEVMILEEEVEECRDKEQEIDEQDRPILTLRDEMQMKQKFEEELNRQKQKIEQLMKRQNELKEQKLCIVCMDQQKCYMNASCRHVSCCLNCIQILDRCPICRKQIYEFEKVYQ